MALRRKPGKVQAALLLLMRSHPHGLTFEQIAEKCPQAGHPAREALRSLIAAGMVWQGDKTKGREIVYFPTRGLLDVDWGKITEWQARAGAASAQG